MVTKANNITKIPDSFIPSTNIRLNETDYLYQVNRYIQELERTPPIGATKTGTIVDFFKLVKQVIKTRQTTENVPENKRILFLEDYPPEDLDTFAITYELDIRKPGLVSRGSAGSTGVKEVSSHIRSISDDAENPGQKVIERGKFYDHIVTFYSYARSSNIALEKALWLENVVESFDWYFKYFGFRVVEAELSKKEYLKIGNLDLVRYPLSYHVRCDSLHYVYSQELRELSININLQ